MPNLVERQVEEAVVLEERAAVAPPHDFKKFRLGFRQRRRKIPSGFLGNFRSCAIDDDIDGVGMLWKSGIELPLALPPVEIRRDKLACIGRNGKIGADVGDRACGQQKPQNDR